MNLTLHILRKDLRHLRIPLLFWIGLMAGQFVLSCLILQRQDEKFAELASQLQAFDAFHEILWAMQLVACYVLAAWHIHADALTGPSSWWMTRPIGGGRLLRAKLLGLVLFFCVLPVVVAVPWWLYCGFGPAELLRAAAETAAWHAALVALALMVAVVTEGAARFLFYTIVLVAGWIFLYGTVHELGRRLGLPASLGADDSGTRVIVSLLLLGAIIATVTVHQYVTRRTWRSWTILVVGLVMLAVTVRFWRGSLDLRPWGEPPELAAITARVGQATVKDEPRKHQHVEQYAAAHVKVEFSGLPEDHGVGGGYARSKWTWPDEVGTPRSTGLSGWALTNARRLIGMTGDQSSSVTVHNIVPVSLARKAATTPPAWDTELELDVWAGDFVVELPLHQGAAAGRNGHRMRILDLSTSHDGDLEISLAETMPVLASYDWQSLAPGARFARAGGYYALVSRDRTRLVPASGAESFLATRTAGVGVVRRNWVFEAVRLGKEGDRDWVKDAVLVKLAFRKVGRIHRQVHTDALVLEPVKPRTPAAK